VTAHVDFVAVQERCGLGAEAYAVDEDVGSGGGLPDDHLAVGVPLQQGASTHNLQRLAKGMGWGPDDSSSVLRVYEMMLRRKVKQ